MKIKKILNSKKTEFILLSLVFLGFFIPLTVVSLHRYWQYEVWYYDFGIFFTGISAVSRLQTPIIDHLIYPGSNILGDHFHPFIFTISPIFALTKRAESLLIMQALYVASSGIIMYLVAKEVLKKKFEAMLLLIIYFSFIGLHNAIITEFHAITLLPLPLSLFFLGLVKKSKKIFFLGLVLTLLVKETVFIIPAWFGFWLAVKNKGYWRKVGLFTSAISFAYGFLVIKFLIPQINGQGYYYLNDALQSSSFSDLLSIKKLRTVFNTLLSFGFLPLLAPETWPPILFNWWSRFESSGARHDLGMHYNAEIAPTLLLGSIYGWKRLRKVNSKIILVFIAIFTVFLSLFIFKSPSLMFSNKAMYAHTKNFTFLDKLINNIPDDGTVMAQHHLAGRLAYRKVFMLRNNYADYSPDYIVIDTRGGQGANNFLGVEDFDDLVKNLKADSNYEIYYSQGEQMIYRKISSEGI